MCACNCLPVVDIGHEYTCANHIAELGTCVIEGGFDLADNIGGLGAGIAGVHGSEGDYAWGGYGGTFFWVDPKEQLIGLMMAQTPGASRQYYRRMIKTLVYQALD